MYKKALIPALVATIISLATPALAETIFRWVDGNGQVHYSDVPSDGAEQVELNPAQSFSAPAVTRTSPSPEQAAEEGTTGYKKLEIVSPSQEETIWNTGGVITVAVKPNPSLMEGHSVNIYYDGKPIESKGPRATSVQLSEVHRGEHRISAEILNSAGAVVMSARPVTFFYKQSSSSTGLGTPKVPIRALPKVRPGAF